MFGKSHTEEARLKIKEARAKQIISDETKIKMSISAKKVPKLTCPHCALTGATNNLKRYHFENCKKMENK
jgi:predicted hydrocarbon binding protein